MITVYKRFSTEDLCPIYDNFLSQTALALELMHGKNFKDVALRFNTSQATVMRQFDKIEATHLKKTKELPRIIAIDEYKGDTNGEAYKTIIAAPLNRQPLEDRKKETVKAYLKQYGGKWRFL